MFVEKILEGLPAEVKKKELEEINNVRFSPDIQKWVDECEKIGTRDAFFWKWIYRAIQQTTFSSVDNKYLQSMWENDFLFIIYIVLLDDLVDNGGSKSLLAQLFKIPVLDGRVDYGKLKNKKEKEYLRFAVKIWRRVNSKIIEYPRYEEFKEILHYDIKQIINAMEYDSLVNHNHYLINKREYWMYAPNTMQIVFAATLNLMCMPSFKVRELGFLREVVLGAQKMGRIANWLSTWERELKQDDFTSGVFAYAIELGIISPDDLKKENYAKITRKIREAKIEKNILRDWERYYVQINKIKGRISSIDVDKFLLGTKKLLIMYFVTRGKI